MTCAPDRPSLAIFTSSAARSTMVPSSTNPLNTFHSMCSLSCTGKDTPILSHAAALPLFIFGTVVELKWPQVSTTCGELAFKLLTAGSSASSTECSVTTAGSLTS